MSLTSDLYSIGRIASKAGSILNDAENIAKGRPDKVVKKAAKRQAYKGLTSLLRGL